MATVNKDFKIKHGLVVEGSTGTINGEDILTKASADIDYIIDQVGGSGVSTNTPDTLVLRDNAGSFAAQTVTVESLDVSGIGTISDDGELLIAASAGEDIKLTADDVRVEAVDDFRVQAGGDVLFETGVGNNVYVGTIDPGNEVVTESILDTHIGDNTVDGTAGNTVYDRIFNAKSEAISDANDYTDTELLDYTTTANLDTTVGGYGYLKNADLPTMYSDADARNAVSAGSGLDYNSTTGEFSANLGYGLEFDGNGQVRIDDNVIATDLDVSDAFTAHNVSSGVHGVTGNIVGTTDTQTISNKTLGGDLAAGGFQITNLGAPQNSTDAATKAYVDAVSEGLHVHEAARVAIQGNISIANGLENGDTAGGVTLATGDRVLVKDQTIASENGIYVVQASGQALRATDFDTAAEVDSGDFIFVTSGTYANTGWVQTLRPATIGTDALSFTQFSGAGTYTAGNGLTLDGTEFKIDETITATRTYVDEELDAHIDLTDNVHGVNGSVVGTSDSQILTNKTLGSGTTLGADLDAINLYKITNLVDPSSNQDAATKYYVDSVSSGVGGDLTTHENATTGVHGVTGNIVGDSDSQTLTNKTIDGSDNTISNIGNASLTNSEVTINNNSVSLGSSITLDTDDIAEGSTNEYFTDARAAASAAALLTSANLTNITITGTGAGLTITAENGVADSDTDDLTEGTTNLYFTNVRAVDALEAVVPNFTAVEVNSLAKQVAATASAPTGGSQITAYSFAKADYRSAEFLVKTSYGSHTEVAKVLLTLDASDNIAITEYGIVGTNGSSMSITADISGTDVRLRVTPTNNSSTVNVVGTLLA